MLLTVTPVKRAVIYQTLRKNILLLMTGFAMKWLVMNNCFITDYFMSDEYIDCFSDYLHIC